jgi:hypothetical protein
MHLFLPNISSYFIVRFKYIKERTLLFLCMLCQLYGQCQNDSVSDIDFLSTQIKTVYASYKEKITDKKFDSLVRKIKKDKFTETFELLSKLTAPFRDLHLVLYDLNVSKVIDTGKCKISAKDIIQYFENKQLKKDKYEGFWLSEYNNCIIALKKIYSSPITYYGYIIETKTKLIPGFNILKLVKKKEGYYKTDYTEESLGYRIFLESKFNNPNTLLLNSYGKWKKIKNYQNGYLSLVSEFNYKPKLTIIDSNSILIKMADFGRYNIKIYDSLIKANDSIISKTKTLIIDIRNNTGGTINNYLSLLKYIYTNPIVHCGGYQLCSDYLIEDLKQDIKNYYSKGDTLKAKKTKKKLASMITKRGGYLYIPSDTLLKNSNINEYPKNIAVIVNSNCVSAAELMLLDFKQSTKVKIFGEITGGALDNLDALEIELPKTKYTLFIATTKRQLTPSQPRYDNIGIKPDIPIADSIEDWVDFVKNFYANK